jgi:predicted AlkP superfamily phosphohydrolase/phosphomutase
LGVVGAAQLFDNYALALFGLALAKHLLKTRPWDFAMAVDMGPDRLHHGFWKYFDPKHHKHEPGHPLGHRLNRLAPLIK